MHIVDSCFQEIQNNQRILKPEMQSSRLASRKPMASNNKPSLNLFLITERIDG